VLQVGGASGSTGAYRIETAHDVPSIPPFTEKVKSAAKGSSPQVKFRALRGASVGIWAEATNDLGEPVEVEWLGPGGEPVPIAGFDFGQGKGTDAGFDAYAPKSGAYAARVVSGIEISKWKIVFHVYVQQPEGSALTPID
jgi:hypothetical protein